MANTRRRQPREESAHCSSDEGRGEAERLVRRWKARLFEKGSVRYPYFRPYSEVASLIVAPFFWPPYPAAVDPGYVYQAPAPAYWYYCPSYGAYYPNVQSCPEPWVPVPG